MKNVVTFKTAARLKEAGFPQPEPERGQVWYSGFGTTDIVLSGDGAYLHCVCGNRLRVDTIHRDDFNWRDFAPTATDIIWHLPSDYELYHSERNEDFVLHIRDERNEISDFFHDQNPAEAAAAAWLEIQKQKSDE